MTNIQKIKLSQIFTSAPFATVIMFLYFQNQNINLNEAFTLIGIYSFFIVLFEFPTGVIADYYSHKLSLTLGYLATSIALALFMIPAGFWFYAFNLVLLALGSSLASGSNTAYLHTHSKDFKKDFIQLRTYGLLASFIASASSPLFFKINPLLPFIIHFLCFAISSFLILISKDSTKKETSQISNKSGNIFRTAKKGLLQIINNKQLFHIILLSSLFGAVFFNLKWLNNPFLSTLKLDISYWGIIMGLGILLVALGTKLTHKFSQNNNLIFVLLFALTFSMMAFTDFFYLAVSGFLLTHLIRGIFETKLSVEINNSIQGSQRASILSFQNFLIRLFSIGLTALFALIAKYSNFQILIIFTGFLLIILSILPLLKIHKLKKA